MKGKAMKLRLLVKLAVLSIVLSSCATIITGTKQKVQVNSSPQGAKVEVDGIERGVTPLAVKLKKGNEGQTITLTLEGYETKSFEAETGFNTVAILNLFGILGWGIDAATGALWKYDPKYYNITLQAKPN